MARAGGAVLAVAVMVFVMPASARGTDPSPDRKVEFEPAAPSFGSISRRPDADLTLDVTVRNRSKETLDLRAVQIGCGCMSAKALDPASVAPGAAGIVRITLDHRRLRIGRVAYPMALLHADQPYAMVNVEYDYDPAVAVEPAELFIDVEGGEASGGSTDAVVLVRRPVRQGEPPPRVECDDERFTAELLAPAGASRGQYRLDVRSAADALPVGNTDTTLAVFLPGSTAPDLTVPLHCTVRPPVTAQPEAVALKPVRGDGATVRRTLTLVSRRPFTVKSIGSSSPAMTVTERKPAGGDVAAEDGSFRRTYELDIRPTAAAGDPAAGAGDTFEAEVRVEVRSPAEFRLVVPVVGEIIHEP